MKKMIILLFMILSTTFCHATIIKVPLYHSTIQAAIDAASENDTVLVSDGDYTGLGNQNLNLNGKNLVIKSVNGPVNTAISCSNNKIRSTGFTFESGEDNSTIIEGFTIRYAANTAVIIKNGSSPKFIDCNFVHNGASSAVYCLDSSPEFIDCNFKQNWSYGNCFVVYGGAMHFTASSPILTRCKFIENTSKSWCYSEEGGSARAYGGAVAFNGSPQTAIPQFNYCLFYNNSAVATGWYDCYNNPYIGWWCQDMVTPYAYGGAVYTRIDLNFNNCTFAENSITSASSGIAPIPYTPAVVGKGSCISIQGDPTINMNNCIVSFNTANLYVAPLQCNVSNTYFMSCTNIYGNDYGDWVGCLAGQETINGNFSSDPLFIEYSDNHLQVISPCLPENNDCGNLIGTYGVLSCVDINKDDQVDLADYHYFQSNYLECQDDPNPPELGDLDCDGAINLIDLTLLRKYLFENNVSLCCEN